jgi:hypothetical protein
MIDSLKKELAIDKKERNQVDYERGDFEEDLDIAV